MKKNSKQCNILSSTCSSSLFDRSRKCRIKSTLYQNTTTLWVLSGEWEKDTHPGSSAKLKKKNWEENHSFIFLLCISYCSSHLPSNNCPIRKKWLQHAHAYIKSEEQRRTEKTTESYYANRSHPSHRCSLLLLINDISVWTSDTTHGHTPVHRVASWFLTNEQSDQCVYSTVRTLCEAFAARVH